MSFKSLLLISWIVSFIAIIMFSLLRFIPQSFKTVYVIITIIILISIIIASTIISIKQEANIKEQEIQIKSILSSKSTIQNALFSWILNYNIIKEIIFLAWNENESDEIKKTYTLFKNNIFDAQKNIFETLQDKAFRNKLRSTFWISLFVLANYLNLELNPNYNWDEIKDFIENMRKEDALFFNQSYFNQQSLDDINISNIEK